MSEAVALSTNGMICFGSPVVALATNGMVCLPQPRSPIVKIPIFSTLVRIGEVMASMGRIAIPESAMARISEVQSSLRRRGVAESEIDRILAILCVPRRCF